MIPVNTEGVSLVSRGRECVRDEYQLALELISNSEFLDIETVGIREFQCQFPILRLNIYIQTQAKAC